MMKTQLIQKLCIGGFAAMTSLSALGQVTTVTETFDDNKISNFRAGQGYFVKAENQVLKVIVGKQQWEEFSYDLLMNLKLQS